MAGFAAERCRIFSVLGTLFFLMAGVAQAAVEPIRIAVIFAHTGIAASDNISYYLGARLAAEQINAKGGLLGRPLQLIELDNQSSAQGSVDAALQAAQQNVIGVVGASWSSHSLAMAPVLQQAGVPMISPQSSNVHLTEMGPYIFRACFDDNLQGQVLASFAYHDLAPKSVGVMVNMDSDFSLGIAEIFMTQYRKLGGRVVLAEEYREKDTDFVKSLTSLKNTQPEVIFLPGYPLDSGLIIRQARQMGITSTFLGTDAWSQSLQEFGGERATGSYFATQVDPHAKMPRALAYEAAFKARFPDAISNTGTVQTYDAVCVLADAIRRAGTDDRAKVQQALAATKNLDIASGHIDSFSNGTPQGRATLIMKIMENDVVLVKTFLPMLRP